MLGSRQASRERPDGEGVVDGVNLEGAVDLVGHGAGWGDAAEGARTWRQPRAASPLGAGLVGRRADDGVSLALVPARIPAGVRRLVLVSTGQATPTLLILRSGGQPSFQVLGGAVPPRVRTQIDKVETAIHLCHPRRAGRLILFRLADLPHRPWRSGLLGTEPVPAHRPRFRSTGRMSSRGEGRESRPRFLG